MVIYDSKDINVAEMPILILKYFNWILKYKYLILCMF